MDESIRQNIGIVGGGMVGLLAALAFEDAFSTSCAIHVFDVAPLDLERPLSQPSFDDRSTALSFDTLGYMSGLGLLEISRQACPIQSIHVSNKGRMGSAVLTAEQVNWPQLGGVIENRLLGEALAERLKHSRVRVHAPREIRHINPKSRGVELFDAQGEAMFLDCLIIADGGQSALAQRLGMLRESKSYANSAIVANVATAVHHGYCAYERFSEQGPMAMLPLGDADGVNRCALVWTAPKHQIDELMALTDREFCRSLEAQFGYRLGRIEQVGTRSVYPLQMMHRIEQVRAGIVVLGNAAHTLHPVAGQGFNLSVRDIRSLTDVLSQCVYNNDFSSAALSSYAQRRAVDQWRTVNASDLLPNLFQYAGVVGAVRNFALGLMDLIPAFKQRFTAIAAGAIGEGDYV